MNEEYENFDDIPAAYRHLFKQQGGKWVLLSAGEVKTVEDVNKLQESLRKERNDHKETKKKFEAFGDEDPEIILEKLDRIEELEAAAGGKLDEEKINEMVEKRLKSKTAPIERELEKTRKEKVEFETAVKEYEQKEKIRKIHDSVRKAAKTENMRDTAVEDALILGERLFDVDENGNVVTKDNVGVTPGVDPMVWLTEVKNTRPHWWPDSVGAGAKGGSSGNGSFANNPFLGDSWNMTEQGRIFTENPERARQLATAAGTTVGGPRPTVK